MTKIAEKYGEKIAGIISGWLEDNGISFKYCEKSVISRIIDSAIAEANKEKDEILTDAVGVLNKFKWLGYNLPLTPGLLPAYHEMLTNLREIQKAAHKIIDKYGEESKK